MNQPAISTQNLCRSYTLGKKSLEILHNISLEIKTGERVFLCGPSGAGKTTLMYTLAGLERPNSGQVFIEGVDLYALSTTKQAQLRNDKLGFIFQNYLLMPELTALENAALASSIGGKDGLKQAQTFLERVGLSERLDHLPNELSGGEQQRVAIARALANNPSIIFADEPTGNLDSKNGKEILNLLFSLAQETHKTLVIVTHDKKIATMGDRIIQLEDGILH